MAGIDLGWGQIFNQPQTTQAPSTAFGLATRGTVNVTPFAGTTPGAFAPATSVAPRTGYTLPSAPATARGVFGSPDNIYAAPSGIGPGGQPERYYKASTDLAYPSRSVELASDPRTAAYTHSSTACSSTFEGFAERMTSLLTRNPLTRESINEALNLAQQCLTARQADTARFGAFDQSHKLAYDKVSRLGNFIAGFYNAAPLVNGSYPPMRIQNKGFYFVVDFNPMQFNGQTVNRLYIDAKNVWNQPPTGGRRVTRKRRTQKRRTIRRKPIRK
jgi:hypothetical protein